MPSVHVLGVPSDDDPFKKRLRGYSVSKLIEAYNSEIGKPGWTSSRARFMAALHDALLATGLDCSSFIEDGVMRLDHPIQLENRKLVPVVPEPDPMILSGRFTKALGYASKMHRGQARKGTSIPYISHVLGVASLALEHGASEDQAIAALLHDVVEDSKEPKKARREIRRRFGPEVARLVEGCTDSDVHPKPPWRKRKRAYLAHLRRARADVRLVSSADKLHNARAILSDYRQVGEELWDRFTGGREGTLWYYAELVKVFQKGGMSPLVEELARTVEEIERLSSAGERERGGKDRRR